MFGLVEKVRLLFLNRHVLICGQHAALLFSPSRLVVSLIRGHIAGSSAPSPLRFVITLIHVIYVSCHEPALPLPIVRLPSGNVYLGISRHQYIFLQYIRNR